MTAVHDQDGCVLRFCRSPTSRQVVAERSGFVERGSGCSGSSDSEGNTRCADFAGRIGRSAWANLFLDGDAKGETDLPAASLPERGEWPPAAILLASLKSTQALSADRTSRRMRNSNGRSGCPTWAANCRRAGRSESIASFAVIIHAACNGRPSCNGRGNRAGRPTCDASRDWRGNQFGGEKAGSVKLPVNPSTGSTGS
jgi:hypothetical protein